MSCRNYVLDEDGERICECGDEGRLCTACSAQDAAYWRGLWNTCNRDGATLGDVEQYEQDMRDAGRGHLLPP